MRFGAMGFGRRAMGAGGVLVAAMMVAGCGLFGGASTAPTAVPTRTPLPTFTPTAAVTVQQAAAPTTAPVEVAAAPAAAQPAATEAPPAPAELAATPTAAPKPVLAITADAVNVRAAPSTDAELVGLATIGQQFDVTARTAAGDWWQVCCVNGQAGWVYGELATVTGGEAAPIASDVPAPVEPAPVAEAPTEVAAEAAPVPDAPATEAPAAVEPGTPPDPSASSAGWFDPNAQYQITNFRVLGLGENNGGIRDTSAQHLIFLTVLDQNGNGVDGAVVRNLVGEKGEVTTGAKGPGKAEITMYYEPFKLAVVSDPSGPVTSQVSNQMGLIFPHLPDIVGKLGDASYEYGACPTLEDRCQWPLSDVNYVHFSYEITFQKVK